MRPFRATISSSYARICWTPRYGGPLGKREYTQPAESTLQQTAPSLVERPEFSSLGFHPPILAALRSAFPEVKQPTDAQVAFIPAILSGKDVLLRDLTGSGKSFGILMALLNKPRLTSTTETQDGPVQNQHITSLFIVPHRDLAYQFSAWVQRLLASPADTPPPPLASVVQTLVRDGGSHLSVGIPTLRRTVPHVLIGTPQALWDVWQQAPDVLQLNSLSSVVVDEVDYLVETLPNKDPRRSFHGGTVTAKRKLLAHPGVTRGLLDVIYSKRKIAAERLQDEPGLAQLKRRSSVDSDGRSNGPQLILSSATLRSHLTNYLFDESGWLNKDNLLKVKGRGSILDRRMDEHTPLASGLGASLVSHSILVVSNDGIKNISGARPYIKGSDPELPITPESIFGATKGLEPESAENVLADRYHAIPSPFNPNAFEAIATAIALDVPSAALLVLPSSAAVQRAVHELRELGVNAQGLDLQSRGGRQDDNKEPKLIVGTLATIRGLDLTELSHVFMLGLPEGGRVTGRAVDSYVHVMGRVGRFGRRGRVISVVEERESDKMNEILRRLDLVAVEFEYFD